MKMDPVIVLVGLAGLLLLYQVVFRKSDKLDKNGKAGKRRGIF